MLTIKETISKWLDTIENPNTVSTYKNSLVYFVESLEISQDEAISKLTLDNFIHFIMWIAKEDLSKASMQLHSSAVKNYINFLVINDLFEFDHTDKEKIKKATKKYIGKKSFNPIVATAPANAIETMIYTAFKQKIYSPIRERDIALILFLSTSGCRRSEVANLKVSDVDVDSCFAIIYGGRGDKGYRVFISPHTCDAISSYWEARGTALPSDPAFARHDNKSSWRNGLEPLSVHGIYIIIARLSELAGIEKGVITPNSFRHHFATKFASDNIKFAEEQLGYSSYVATERYVHFTQNESAHINE